jgi:uncharacterized protein YgbK (DUF1537 family)
VLSGRIAIRSEVLSGIAAGAEVIIADALTTEHIDLIGTVVAELTRESGGGRQRTGRTPATGGAIDPGPGSLSLARAFLPARTRSILLGVSGSATEVTRTQLAALPKTPTSTVMRAARLPRAARCRGHGPRGLPATSARAIIIATVLDATDLRELTAEQSELIPCRLAMITTEVMDSDSTSPASTPPAETSPPPCSRVSTPSAWRSIPRSSRSPSAAASPEDAPQVCRS